MLYIIIIKLFRQNLFNRVGLYTILTVGFILAKKKKNKKKKAAENGVSDLAKNTKRESTLPFAQKHTEEWQTVQSKNSKAVKTETLPSSKPTLPASSFDPAKRLKNLKKKIRDIEMIEGKMASGEVKSLDKDQLDKVNRKADILSDILALELSLGQ